MNNHLLSSNEFHLGTISRSDSNVDIRYHSDMNKRETDRKKLHELLDESYYLFHALNLPIFYKEGGRYYLVARRWILDYIIDHDIDEIHIIYFENKDKIADVLKLDELESEFLPKKRVRGIVQKKEMLPSKSNATASRRRSKKTGRICPFCNGPLAEEGEKSEDTPPGYHRITCYYKTIKAYNCQFTALLTDFEFAKFTSWVLPTDKWLMVTTKSMKCGQPVYRRIMDFGKGKKTVLDLCKNYFVSGGKCTYQILK